MAHHDLTGHTLGQYTITARLGRGGMADVYKAYHPKLEVYRAIKVIRPEFVTASDFRERFQKEAQSVAALRHSNIVQIHDFGEDGDSYYMVMEFIEGKDLKHVIQAGGKIRPIRRAVEIVDQVADALHYAHARGLIHRDIKPENIMINEEGLPILMDFGIAKLLTANTQLTQTGMGIGTPSYMAPEQAKALPEIGPPADIYSLSVVLYEMLTGQVPFSADTPMAVMLKAINDPMPMPRQFSGDISEDLQQVILKGTAKEPNNRYSSAKRFREALREALEKEPSAPAGLAATEVMDSAQDTQPATAAQEPTRQRPGKGGNGGALAGVAVLVALLAAGGGYYWWRQHASAGESQVAGAAGTVEQQSLVEQAGEGAGEPAPSAATGGRDRAVLDGGGAAAGSAEGGQGGGVPRAVMPEGAPVAGVATPSSDEPVAEEVAGGTGGGGDAGLGTGAEEKAAENASGGQEPEPKADQPAAAESQKVASVRGMTTSTPKPKPEPQAPVMTDGGSLRLGRYVNESIAVPGRAVAYTLEADAGQTIFFDHVDNTEPTRRMAFTLLAPDGHTQVFKSRSDFGPVTLEQSGTYKLVASPGDSRVSGFQFVVWELDPAQVNGGPLRLGQPVKGHTSVPGQSVSYSLFANSGQTIALDQVEATEATEFTLTAPDGTSRVFRTRGDFGPVALNQSGTYTLVADPEDDFVSQFKFVVRPAGLN